jgi:hypothetical protein
VVVEAVPVPADHRVVVAVHLLVMALVAVRLLVKALVMRPWLEQGAQTGGLEPFG